jgi:uncharacterized membrane protein
MPQVTMPICLAVGVLVILVAIPLAKRRIPPNRWYGFRVPATFADREVWFETNAQAGRDLIYLGLLLVLVAFGLAMLASPLLPQIQMLLYALVLVVGSIVITVRGMRLASRLLAERRRFEKPRA